MNFIRKYGRHIDLIGAALFAILAIVAFNHSMFVFSAGLLLGFLAFLLSALIWTIRRDNIVDDMFHEDETPARVVCWFLAIASAVLLLIASIGWVLA